MFNNNNKMVCLKYWNVYYLNSCMFDSNIYDTLTKIIIV